MARLLRGRRGGQQYEGGRQRRTREVGGTALGRGGASAGERGMATREHGGERVREGDDRSPPDRSPDGKRFP
jgi:hypothetical protein